MGYSWETSTSTGSSGGGGYSWEKPKPKKPSSSSSSGGGGFFSGGVGGFISNLGKDIHSLEQNFVPGLVEQGRSVYHDIGIIPGGFGALGRGGGGAPLPRSAIKQRILDPQVSYYRSTYGPAFQGRFGETGHMIYQHPLNPILDLAAVGTLPFGAEGLAGRAASVGARFAPEAAITKSLARLSTKLETGRYGPIGRDRGVQTYMTPTGKEVEIIGKPSWWTPPGGEPIPFQVPRARTVQGRLVYDPVRELIGRAFDGRTPILGNAARYTREWHRTKALETAPFFHPLADFDRAMSPFKLNGTERLTLHIAAEYGPSAAKAADLGAPRQQLVTFYKAELEKTLARYADAVKKNHVNVATEEKLIEKAQRRALKDLGEGNAKKAARIDAILKTPSKDFEQAVVHARDLWDRMGETLAAAGIIDPEGTPMRNLLEQRVMTGVDAPERLSAEELAAQNAGRPAQQRVEDAFGVPDSVAHAMRGGGVPSGAAKPIRVQMETRINQLIQKGDQSGEIAHFNLDNPADRYVPSEFIPGSLSPEFADYARSALLRHRAIEKELLDAIRQAPDAKTRAVFEKRLEAGRRKFDKFFSQTDPEYARLAAQYREEARGGTASAEPAAGPPGMTIKEQPVSDVNTYRRWLAHVPGREKPVGELIVHSYKGKRGFADAPTRHPEGEIFMVEVDPEFRRQGIATELYNQAKQEMPELQHSTRLSEDAQAWIPSLQKTAEMTPEEMDAALNENPFSPEFEALMAKHPDAFGQPNVGPRIPGGRGGGTGASEAASRGKFNAGTRFTRYQLLRGPEAWRKGYLQAYHFHIQEWQRAKAIERGIALPYDGGIEHPLREGYVPMSKPGAALSRNQKEASALNRHLDHMDDDTRRGVLDNQLREMFPAEHSPSERREIFQVPEAFKKMMEDQNKKANVFMHYLVDKPLAFWKAMTLKYRPAWLVNNIVGNHLLYILFNPLGMKHYVDSLRVRMSPEEWRRFSKALPGSHIGTASLAGESRRGSELAAAHAASTGGFFNKAQYTSRRWFANTVGKIGDGMVKLNQEIADNQPRTAVQIRELKALKRFKRNAEIARGELESRVKGKTLLQVAEEMTPAEKTVMLRKMNVMLGDFGQISQTARRIFPFASWFKVILTITKDLALDHPEKLLFISMLERAAAQDPGLQLGFLTPSWLQGTIPLPFGGGDIKVGLLTQGFNPFSTPDQLENQLSSILSGKGGTGPSSPLASLGPLAEMIEAQRGVDPFSGQSTVSYIPGSGYQGLGKGTPFAGLGSVFGGLPQYRLAQQTGLIGGYHEPKSYQTTVNTALANYFGFPVRNIRRSKAREYAKKGY